MPDTSEESNSYQQYQEMGGIINEKDYESALRRVNDQTTLDKRTITQAENIAEFAGIKLQNREGFIDKITTLYGILRNDARPENTSHHHSQMPDQRLFAEALRMLGDTDALNKLTGAYHKAGIYCPICLRVAASGEECR